MVKRVNGLIVVALGSLWAGCGSSSALTVRDAYVHLSPLAQEEHGESSAESGTTEPANAPEMRHDATAYFTIHGGGEPDRLVGAGSDAAETVELHATQMEGAVARMVQASSVDVPAGRDVRFEPGGHHAMLFGLRNDVGAGDVITLTLMFEQAGTVLVAAPVSLAFP